MQGLFRRETEPRATGHKSLLARKNQRRTSSEVSFLFMYRCNIAPVHNTLSITTLVPSSPKSLNVGQVQPAGLRSVHPVPRTDPVRVVAPIALTDTFYFCSVLSLLYA